MYKIFLLTFFFEFLLKSIGEYSFCPDRWISIRKKKRSSNFR